MVGGVGLGPMCEMAIEQRIRDRRFANCRPCNYISQCQCCALSACCRCLPRTLPAGLDAPTAAPKEVAKYTVRTMMRR